MIGERIYNQRIATVNVSTHALRQVSPEELHVFEYDWSPDGKAFAANAAPGPGDDNWYVAKLYAIDAATGQAIVVAKRIAELDPDDVLACTSLSVLYQKKGMIPEAEAEANKARILGWKQQLKKS